MMTIMGYGCKESGGLLIMPFPDDLDDALRRADPLSEMALESPPIEAALNELGQHLLC